MLLLDESRLESVRERIKRGDADLQPALQVLRVEAEAAMTAGPWSVMDKPVAPPSGDKHDYQSVGPYWWPDPTKVDGLPYVRRDGEENPARENTDHERIKQFSLAVRTLGLAGFLTGEKQYCLRAGGLIRTWFLDPATRMNPHLDFAQGIPGRCEGRGIGIIDTMHLVGLPDVVAMLSDGGSWEADDEAGLVAWMKEYVNWLLSSDHGRSESREHNNHGTWYDAQVATFSLYAGEREIAAKVLGEVADCRIAKHITADGSQPHELKRTRSLSYSIMNLQGLFYLARLGERMGLDLWNYRTPDCAGLEGAAVYLAPYADGRVSWPFEQIIPDTREPLRALLMQARAVYDNPLFERTLIECPPFAAERSRLLWG